MDIDFQEMLKKRSDQELLNDIASGSDSYQDGYYEYFINEAKSRSLIFTIPSIQDKSITKISPEQLFMQYCENPYKSKSIEILTILGLVSIISSIFYFVFFLVWQRIDANNIISFVYPILMLILLLLTLLYPILKVIQLIQYYKFVNHLYKITNPHFSIKGSDVVLSIFPIIGYFYSIWIIYSLNKMLYHFKNSKSGLLIKLGILTKSIAFSFVQIISIYIIINDFNKVKVN